MRNSGAGFTLMQPPGAHRPSPSASATPTAAKFDSSASLEHGASSNHAEAAGIARQLGNILIGTSDSVLAHQTLEEMLRLAQSMDPNDQLAAGLLVESRQVVDELSVQYRPAAKHVNYSCTLYSAEGSIYENLIRRR